MRFARLAAPAILSLSLLTAPLAAEAQQAGKIYRIGFLRADEPPKFWVDEFREGLRELGYVEGQNVVIEFRIGTLDELSRLAEELVRSKVDVIVASASSAGIAAKTATTSIPIVFTSLSHPVEIGLIKSLARPGGNITGVTVNAGATITKRLELLRELVPTLKQVAVLTHPAHPTDPVQRRETEEAARALGLRLKPAPVRGPEDFEAAFKAVSGAGALLNIDTPLFTTYRTQFAELAAEPASGDLVEQDHRGGRRPHVVRHVHPSLVPARRHLRGQSLEGRQARRPPCGASSTWSSI